MIIEIIALIIEMIFFIIEIIALIIEIIALIIEIMAFAIEIIALIIEIFAFIIEMRNSNRKTHMQNSNVKTHRRPAVQRSFPPNCKLSLSTGTDIDTSFTGLVPRRPKSTIFLQKFL